MPTRALITSGGGAKGAFTVGALNALSEMGIKQYDFVSGTSTGALLSALAVVGQFSQLESIYLSVTNDDILKKQNIVDNILNDRPFVYDTDPLQQMIERHVTREVFTKIMASTTILCLTAVSLQTGKIEVFCTKPVASTRQYHVSLITTHQQLKDALLASSSQAGFLKPVSIEILNDQNEAVVEQFVDGGNRDVIPSRIITDLAPDEIYVLSNNPPTLFKGQDDYSQSSVIAIIMRAISIFIQDVRENDIAVLEAYQQRTGARVFRIEPGHDLDPEHPTGLNFNADSMAVWMALGRKKAAALVAANGLLRPA